MTNSLIRKNQIKLKENSTKWCILINIHPLKLVTISISSNSTTIEEISTKFGEILAKFALFSVNLLWLTPKEIQLTGIQASSQSVEGGVCGNPKWSG